jgi:hypothetical protein
MPQRSQRSYDLEAAEAAIGVYSLSALIDSDSEDFDELEAAYRNLEEIKSHRILSKATSK